MLNAIQGVKFMLIAIHGLVIHELKLYAHCYTRSEAMCSFKHSSEALSSLLYMK